MFSVHFSFQLHRSPSFSKKLCSCVSKNMSCNRESSRLGRLSLYHLDRCSCVSPFEVGILYCLIIWFLFLTGGSRNDKINNNCAFCFLEKRIRLSLTIDVPVDSPTKILDCLQRSTKLFRVGRQEDAHELLRYAIEACNSACIQLQKPVAAGNRQTKHADGKSKEEPHTIVKEIFGGIIQSQIKCSVCGTESNKLDDIMDLSLDILPRLGSLREAMCRFFMPEVLDGDNKYHCGK